MTSKKKRRPHRVTKAGVKRPRDTGETVEDLEKRLETERFPKLPTDPKAVVQLRRSSIRVAERVFQWRQPKRNEVARDVHILEMAKAVRDKARFPPLLVFPVGRDYYVMDGHHRLAAYDTARWTAPIPAKVFLGSLREAERAALRSNSRDKLPMDKQDKLASAWRLVKEEYKDDSIRSIATDASVSTSSVDNMRGVLRKLKEMGLSREDIHELSWGRARSKASGRPEEEAELEDWREKEAQKIIDDLVRARLVSRLTKHVDITAIALAKLDSGLPAALMEEWREPEEPTFDPHEKGDEPDLEF